MKNSPQEMAKIGGKTQNQNKIKLGTKTQLGTQIGTQITNQITCKVVNKRLKQRLSSQQKLKQLKVLKKKVLTKGNERLGCTEGRKHWAGKAALAFNQCKGCTGL